GALNSPPQESLGSLTGVVEITRDGESWGSGTLLTDGRHVLTAAHPLDHNDDRVADAHTFLVKFYLPTVAGYATTGVVSVPVSAVALHPNWEPGTAPALARNDIAVLTL